MMRPHYRRGNKILLGILAWNFVFIILIKFYYMWKNARREKTWNAMTSEEKNNYLATTKDKGTRGWTSDLLIRGQCCERHNSLFERMD